MSRKIGEKCAPTHHLLSSFEWILSLISHKLAGDIIAAYIKSITVNPTSTKLQKFTTISAFVTNLFRFSKRQTFPRKS